MKLDVPRGLTHLQARLALSLLEYVIDGLIEFFQEMRRVYDITYVEHDDNWPPF